MEPQVTENIPVAGRFL